MTGVPLEILIPANNEAAQIDACLYCHDRGKDSCRGGLRDKQGELQTNPLGIDLAGCPLDEKIGEAQALRRAGEVIGALVALTLDNPLCPVADPVFLGAHLEAGAEASSKVVLKEDPAEKVGLVVERDGATCVVEYSEVSAEQQAARDDDGQLTYRAGSIAVHVFGVEFLRRLVADDFDLDFHVAHKAVAALDAKGEVVKPDKPNGCKFETFVFELLPQAQGHVTFAVERADEFEPLKNASGPCSPETVKQAISDRGRRWLEAAGASLTGVETCEVSPLTAYDAGALARALPGLDLTPTAGKLAV